MTEQFTEQEIYESSAAKDQRSQRNRRTWVWLVVAAVVVLAVGAGATMLLRSSGSAVAASGPDTLNFAEVMLDDLIQEESFSGTLGSIEDDPITTQLGGTITSISKKGETVGQGETLFSIDDQPVVLLYGDVPAYRDMAIGEDVVAVSIHLNGTITWVAEPGTVIEEGDVLYRVDDQPVVVLYGAQPAYRTLDLAGPDLAVAAAQGALSSTRANLTTLTKPPSEQQIQAAQQTFTGAQHALQDLLDLPDPVAVQVAEAQLANSEAALQQAQLAYDQVAHLPNVGMLYQSLQLQTATNNHQVVLAQYNQAILGASPGQIANAQAQVAQAQANLDALMEGPNQDAVAAAQAQVEQAQGALDILLSESSPVGPGYDVLQLKRALADLGYDRAYTVSFDEEFTPATQQMVRAWQEDIGTVLDGVVDHGEVLFLPGPAQVLDVLTSPGGQAMGDVVSLSTGDLASGADIRQLEEALAALGYDADGALVADGTYTPETTQAVLAFQASAGIEQDGIIDLGEVMEKSSSSPAKFASPASLRPRAVEWGQDPLCSESA